MSAADTPRSVLLDFDPRLDRIGNDKRLRDGLSAMVRVGRHLWLANDEALSLECLTLEEETPAGPVFGKHRQFRLDELLDLPVPPKPDADDFEEADIEGLDFADGALWLVGSHSRKRSKTKPKRTDAENIERLARIGVDGNRCLLARIPLEADGDRPPVPRRGACLGGDAGAEALIRALRDDEHLAPFLALPGKDNGFDVEGLAVAGDRVFLGLRGPVLRGWAVVLELRPEPDGQERLALQAFAGKGRGYRKHFLDLRGLGIRDLRRDGDDLLILAGPTQELDAPARVFRWPDGTRPAESSLVPREKLPLLATVPCGDGVDRAEGLERWPAADGSAGFLIVYDQPAPSRLREPAGVTADLLSPHPTAS